MRDPISKMAELKFEAPLAQFEDEWTSGNEFNAIPNTNNNTIKSTLNINLKNDLALLEQQVRDAHVSKNGSNPNCNNITDTIINANIDSTTTMIATTGKVVSVSQSDNINMVDTFTETFSGSLEDLVNTFDEKITKCFGNYEENVEDLAPVQIRSQEEIMNECQMWWTITGNFGNILPIDWSKSYARQLHLPTLKLPQECEKNEINRETDLSSEDEAVANDLDMHTLILNGFSPEAEEPLKTADEIIKEIENIIDETNDLDEEVANYEIITKAKEVLKSPLYEEKLQSLNMSQLNELYIEMEVLIREFSETLINELALRDELEYEKELKNTFISLLLAVQNKRRQYHVEKKRGKVQGMDTKYLTTVIPYHLENGAPDNQALQVLIKILKAINDNSPTVPTLLTDYILKVLCPT